MKTYWATLLVFTVFFTFSFGCNQKSQKLNDPWEYPIKVGDSIFIVHKYLSGPSYPDVRSEKYPKSGVTIYYSGRNVSQITFTGEAAALISVLHPVWEDEILYDKPFFAGITAHSNDDKFKRVLGPPLKEYADNRNYKGFRPTVEILGKEIFIKPAPILVLERLHQTWEKDGYLIEASFINFDSTYQDKVFKKGTLLWVTFLRGFDLHKTI